MSELSQALLHVKQAATKLAVSAEWVARGAENALDRGVSESRMTRFLKKMHTWAGGANKRVNTQLQNMSSDLKLQLPEHMYQPAKSMPNFRLTNVPWTGRQLKPELGQKLYEALGGTGKALPIHELGAYGGHLMPESYIASNRSPLVLLHELGHQVDSPKMRARHEYTEGQRTPDRSYTMDYLGRDRLSHIAERKANRPVFTSGVQAKLQAVLGEHTPTPAQFTAHRKLQEEGYKTNYLRNFASQHHAGPTTRPFDQTMPKRYPFFLRRVANKMYNRFPAAPSVET